MAEEMG